MKAPEALLGVPAEAAACTINAVAESGELGADGESSAPIALLSNGLEAPIIPSDPVTLCAAEMVFLDSDAGTVPTGSKNKPLTTALALAPVRVVTVINTFPDIAQLRYSPLAKLDTVCVFSRALVLASVSVTVSDLPLAS
jgi:hypothetical protein